MAITTGKQRTRRLEVQRALGRRRDSLVTEVAPGIKGCSEDLRNETCHHLQAVRRSGYMGGMCTTSVVEMGVW